MRPMRYIKHVLLAGVLAGALGLLAGCDSPQSAANQGFIDNGKAVQRGW